MRTLQPHQQRVVDEKNELSEAERSRLRNQARFMDGYAAVLEERIAAFGA